MARVVNDARGTTITVGTRVAFNYSGDIAVGVVEKITGTEFHIRRETHLTGYYATNPISKVRKVSSLLAIFEIEDIEKATKELRKQVLDDFANANKELFRVVADAWDLHEVELYLEERYGKNWKEQV